MELRIMADVPTSIARPLDEVQVSFGSGPDGAELIVLDGAHRQYVCLPAAGDGAVFTAAGALGKHVAILRDEDGKELDRATFTVDCRTRIDHGGPFAELLDVLDYTMNRRGAMEMAQVDGRTYSFFVRWLRDHVHTLKGNKYFHAGLKSGIDLYLDTQCENGMVWTTSTSATPARTGGTITSRMSSSARSPTAGGS